MSKSKKTSITKKYSGYKYGIGLEHEMYIFHFPYQQLENDELIKNITYSEVISKNLRIMDMTAISLAKESNIPIYITNIFEEDSLLRALKEDGSYSKIG